MCASLLLDTLTGWQCLSVVSGAIVHPCCICWVSAEKDCWCGGQIAPAQLPCPLQDVQHDSIVHVLTFYTAHVQQKQRIVELE